MAVVLSTHPLHEAATRALERGATLEIAPEIAPHTLIREGREADVAVVRAPLPAELFDRAGRLRAVIRRGSGVDIVPVEAATRAGFLVANAPGANACSVAEYAIFAALALLRRFREVDRDLRGTGWLAGRRHAERGRQLSGRVLGLVGWFGRVGREITDIAAGGFRMRVVADGPHARGSDPTVGLPAWMRSPQPRTWWWSAVR